MSNPLLNARSRRQVLGSAFWASVLSLALHTVPTVAQTLVPPDELIKDVSSEVLELIKADKDLQAGSLPKIVALVDGKLMPHVNFPRMTAIAVGRAWRTATPEQRSRLQEEFKALLLRTYAGALTQVKDQSLSLKPFRAHAEDTEVVVKTELKGKGEPVAIDYRLEKTATGWKVYDVNVLGVWLADTSFKSQFAPILGSSGLDGLISSLADLNRKSVATAKKG